MSDMEALSRVDQVAVSLPAPGPVVDGFLKMIAGQLVTSDEGHTLKEVHTLTDLSEKPLVQVCFPSGGQTFCAAWTWEAKRLHN